MGNPHVRRPSPGEEAGEMRRKRPARPRVLLNRDAVWALLDQLGISQNEPARRCGRSPGCLSQLTAGKSSPWPCTLGRRKQELVVSDLGSLLILEPAEGSVGGLPLGGGWELKRTAYLR